MLTPNQKMWVDALRSGKYKQGHDALHTKTERGDRFCCLGVGCDLYQKHGPGDLKVHEGTLVSYDFTSGYPPFKVMQWLGISDAFMRSLARMNDGARDIVTGKVESPKRRFSTIANRIEDEFVFNAS